MSKYASISQKSQSEPFNLQVESHSSHPYPIPTKILEKTDIELQGIADAATTDVAAAFDIILVEN